MPVVARGAGTGLCAGAMPHKEGVVLSLAKFNQILNIDPIGRTARLQPGVRNLAISEEAAQYGLYYGPDPSSQIACSIGGNVAENSGGVHCLKYGLTVHNILSVEMITAEGDRVTVGSDGLVVDQAVFVGALFGDLHAMLVWDRQVEVLDRLFQLEWRDLA